MAEEAGLCSLPGSAIVLKPEQRLVAPILEDDGACPSAGAESLKRLRHPEVTSAMLVRKRAHTDLLPIAPSGSRVTSRSDIQAKD